MQYEESWALQSEGHHTSTHPVSRCSLLAIPWTTLPQPATLHCSNLAWSIFRPEVSFIQQTYLRDAHTKMKIPLGGLSHRWHYLPTSWSNRILRRGKTRQTRSEIRVERVWEIRSTQHCQIQLANPGRDPEEALSSWRAFRGYRGTQRKWTERPQDKCHLRCGFI